MSAEGSIEVFVGEIGSGKSLVAVGHRILPHLARGGVVCTNLPVMLYPWSSLTYMKSYPGAIKVLYDRFGWQFQTDQLIQLPKDCFDKIHHLIPEGTYKTPVLVVLDEVLEGLDSMDRGDNATRLREVLSFFRHCRHLRVDLVMILQTFDELNNRVRTKATKIWQLRDTNKMRVPVIRCPYPIRNMILMQWWSRKGTELFDQKWLAKASWIYSCYDSHDMSLSSVRCGLGHAKDFSSSQSRKKAMSKYQKVMVAASLIIGLVGLYLGYSARAVSLSAVDRIDYVVGVVSNLPLSRPPIAVVHPVSGVSSNAVASNETVRVCAVVDGRVGLSNGRWVRVGGRFDQFGLLLDVDPASGRSTWSTGVESFDLWCD